jgi:hypothetical protein
MQQARFKALAVKDNPARYVVATKLDDLIASGLHPENSAEMR